MKMSGGDLVQGIGPSVGIKISRHIHVDRLGKIDGSAARAVVVGLADKALEGKAKIAINPPGHRESESISGIRRQVAEFKLGDALEIGVEVMKDPTGPIPIIPTGKNPSVAHQGEIIFVFIDAHIVRTGHFNRVDANVAGPLRRKPRVSGDAERRKPKQ